MLSSGAEDIHERGGMRRLTGTAALLLLLGSIAGACTYDPDDRCGPNQVVYGDNQRCVCAPGTAWTDKGCVACGPNEVSGPSGCQCAPGYSRPAPGAACEAAPSGLGADCDVDSEPCTDPAFPHCQPVDGTSGYCTTSDCTSSADCDGGYACDASESPSYCRRPPLGAGMPCTSNDDCAGTEATYCDVFVSGTCLVEGCTVDPNDYFEGTECCDLSAFGIPLPICIPEGACAS